MTNHPKVRPDNSYAAIRHPLMDVTGHIIEAEGVWLKTPDLQRLGDVVGLVASFTICRISQQLLAPPNLVLVPPRAAYSHSAHSEA
jgi:hypothetical protein